VSSGRRSYTSNVTIVQPPSTLAKSPQPEVQVKPGFDTIVRTREAGIAVIGLGYVGLPLALGYAEAGFRVVGVDLDQERVTAINAGKSHSADVPPKDVAAQVDAGRLTGTTDYQVLGASDTIFICVPTPYTRNKEPDTSRIRAAAEGIARNLRAGQLVILRSTSYPGTTEELVRPILESTGLKIGQDVFLAFAPERVDPGRRDYKLRNTPVLVGGCEMESTARAKLVLEQVVEHVIPMTSPAAAEMAKLLENVFRNVNIALVNQLAMLCDRMGLDIWEITDAAATKPYGFLPFQPGPGIGGHCIPVDPHYLAWKAREFDFHMDFIELAARVNDDMPYYVGTKILLALNGHNIAIHPRILMLGVTFKRDVEDYRDSPALKIMEILRKRGAVVTYHDPHVPSLAVNGQTLFSEPLTPEALAEADCVMIATDHSSFDYDWIVRQANKVFDARNATRHVKEGREKIIRL